MASPRVALLAASRIDGAGFLTARWASPVSATRWRSRPSAGFIATEIPPGRLSLATGLVGAALGAAPFVPPAGRRAAPRGC